jgi:uroporphyrinogen III methyltransferase/synthase
VPDLEGAAVILTRAVADNTPLAALLRGRGADVLELPCIAVRPLANLHPLRRAVRALRGTDRLVVTSRAGIEAVARALEGEPLAAPLAVVGQSTREAAVAFGLRVDFRPSRPDGATLGRELPLPRGIVLLARSDRADAELPTILRGRGADVRDVIAYRTETPTVTDLAAARAFLGERSAIACFASASAVDGFVDLVGEELAARARPVAFGPKTAEHIRRRLGLTPVVSGSPDPQAVARAVRRAVEEVPSGAAH